MAWKTNPDGLIKRSNKALGQWLAGVPFQWYVTQTFKLPWVSPKAADRAWYGWFNSVRLGAKALLITPELTGAKAPFYFRVTEYQDRGTLHYHSLIGGVADIRRLTFKDFWELNGFARVEEYDRGLGANFYVGKYLAKADGDGDIRFSHNLTRLLHTVTVEGI